MKFVFLAFLIAPLVSALSFNAPTRVSPRDGFISLNPELSSLRRIAVADAAVPAPLPTTNAERLRRGLPLKKPAYKRMAARAQPSGTAPTSYTGKLTVVDSDGNVIGGVSESLNQFGEFGVTSSESDFATVSFTAPTDGSPFDVSAPGASTAFPLLGAVSGFANENDDLSAGSFNYAYLGGVTSTVAGGPPVAGDNAFTYATQLDENIESAIWTLDSSTGTLIPTWINTSGEAATTQLVWYEPDNALVIVGDKATFEDALGQGPFRAVSLVFTAA